MILKEQENYLIDLAEGISLHNGIHIDPVILHGLDHDLAQAIMLSQYVYMSSAKGGKEFLYQNENFMYTIGSPDKIKRAKKALQAKGFIKVTLKGLPAKSYIKVNHKMVRQLKVENALTTYESIPVYMSAQQDGAKSTNWIEQIAPTLSRIDNKDNNKDNIKERKKKESIRHNIHHVTPPPPPKGERSSDDELSQGGNDLIKLFEEDLWNNDITPNAGKAGSKKTAFERWKKITKNGQKNRVEVIEGWKRYLAFQKYYGYPVKRLQFFLNPKEELWNSPWEIDPNGAKSKIEKSTFEHSRHPKYWAECFFRNEEITRNEYARIKEISSWKYAGNEFKLLCEKKHKEGYYPKQNIEGNFYFTSDAIEASLKKQRQEQELALKAQEIEKQNPDWKEASSEALPYDSLIDLALKDKELFEKIESWCAFRKFEEAQKEEKAQEANRLKKELAINKIERERDEATNNLFAEFYQWVEENLNLDTFFEEHQEAIKKFEKFLGKDFSLTDALCDIELNKNFEYQNTAIPFKMKLDDFIKKDATCAEKFKNLKKGVREIYKTFNQKKGEIEK